MKNASLAILVPCFNEEELLKNSSELLLGLLKQMKSEGKVNETSKIIFIDDGSTDGSPNILKELAAKDNRVKVLTLRRNFGQTAALACGFSKAESEWVVTLDADLQNDVRDILQP